MWCTAKSKGGVSLRHLFLSCSFLPCFFSTGTGDHVAFSHSCLSLPAVFSLVCECGCVRVAACQNQRVVIVCQVSFQCHPLSHCGAGGKRVSSAVARVTLHYFGNLPSSYLFRLYFLHLLKMSCVGIFCSSHLLSYLLWAVSSSHSKC